MVQVKEKYWEQNNQEQNDKKALVQKDMQFLIQAFRRDSDYNVEIPVFRGDSNQQVIVADVFLPAFAGLKKHIVVAETKFPKNFQKLLLTHTGSKTGVLEPQIPVNISLPMDIAKFPLGAISVRPLNDCLHQGRQPFFHLDAVQRSGLCGRRHQHHILW